LHAQVKLNLKLCQMLSNQECSTCIGVIGHEDETYHLHHSAHKKQPDGNSPLTLDRILSPEIEAPLTRRQRFLIALLLASSVAQLQFTPWLNTGITKRDVLFFSCEDNHDVPCINEPFIRQSFSLDHEANTTKIASCNFYSLGILLLELCFGQRLEDHPLRKKHPTEAKEAFDLMAALEWSQRVGDEAGDDYASAVKWCFTGANSSNQSWRSEMIKNVIRPLEACQQHFKSADVS
jgi:hypothetical protein